MIKKTRQMGPIDPRVQCTCAHWHLQMCVLQKKVEGQIKTEKQQKIILKKRQVSSPPFVLQMSAVLSVEACQRKRKKIRGKRRRRKKKKTEAIVQSSFCSASNGVCVGLSPERYVCGMYRALFRMCNFFFQNLQTSYDIMYGLLLRIYMVVFRTGSQFTLCSLCRADF